MKKRMPPGFGPRAKQLWSAVTEQYDLAATPEWYPLLEDTCREIDIVDRLQAIVNGADSLRERGSQGQPVAMPELQELRQHRALYAALHRQLSQAFEPEMTPKTMSQMGNDARWGRRKSPNG